MEQQVILYPAELSADVCGVQVTGNSPTELYVNVIEAILKRYPGIIGSKETHFTCDSSRAEQYTGTTRGVIINGNTVYIKTGFSTKDKWKGIEKTCQLVAIVFVESEKSAVTHHISQSDVNPLTGTTMEEDIARRYGNKIQQTEEKTYSEEDYKRVFARMYDEFKAKDPNFGEGLTKDEVLQIMLGVIEDQNNHEDNRKEALKPKTPSTESVDKSLNFAYHNEYYLTRRLDQGVRGCDFPSALLDSIGCWYNGYIYLNGRRVGDSRMDQTVFKISEDGTVKAIVSKSKYFQGEIAVNRHGIFRREGKKLYLFDEDGNLLSKITTGTAASIYIYDNRVYILNSKGVLYQYDIFNREEGKIIWKLSDCKERINHYYSEYMSVVSPYVYASEKGKCKFKIGDLYDGQRVCANDQHIIVSIKPYGGNVYFRIDPETYAWSIIDISDGHASTYAKQNAPDCISRELYHIFSLDMKESLIWWCREMENGDLRLFSVPIQPKLPKEMIENPPYRYFLPKRSFFIDQYEYQHEFLSLENFYFDGKSASANDTMSTIYVYPDGRCTGFNTSYQTNMSSVLGKWMYRGNIGNNSHSAVCFVPHDGDTIAEPFDNKKSLWIKKEIFVEAYEKAVSRAK